MAKNNKNNPFNWEDFDISTEILDSEGYPDEDYRWSIRDLRKNHWKDLVKAVSSAWDDEDYIDKHDKIREKEHDYLIEKYPWLMKKLSKFIREYRDVDCSYEKYTLDIKNKFSIIEPNFNDLKREALISSDVIRELPQEEIEHQTKNSPYPYTHGIIAWVTDIMDGLTNEEEAEDGWLRSYAYWLNKLWYHLITRDDFKSYIKEIWDATWITDENDLVSIFWYITGLHGTYACKTPKKEVNADKIRVINIWLGYETFDYVNSDTVVKTLYTKKYT